MKDAYDYDNNKHSLKKTAILLIVLMILAVAGFWAAIKILGKTEKKTVKSNKAQTEQKIVASDESKKNDGAETTANAAENTAAPADASAEESKIDSSNYTVEQLYYNVHLRANTIIVAEGDQIWEESPIDKEFLNYTIELLKDKDETLYNMLLPWKSLDFSNAVDVHNYVWEKLGGTVGKAIGLNENAINEVKQRLSQQ